MIQNGTHLNVVDNSGAKQVCCIKVLGGSQRRYASIGDVLVVSIKSLRRKRRATSKTKKGDVLKALIVRTKIGSKSFSGDNLSFLDNSVVLLNRQYKLIGTRIFGGLAKSFRYTKFIRVSSLSPGLID